MTVSHEAETRLKHGPSGIILTYPRCFGFEPTMHETYPADSNGAIIISNYSKVRKAARSASVLVSNLTLVDVFIVT